ncbi:MAG: polymer-forming cytoskeletal protein [Polyangiaceae bacterium]|nr:polymer-forming cytoskeletal protein [Polyangiaceae bacterium]
MALQRPEMSVLGPTTHVTGRVTGPGGLSVEGRIDGGVQLTGPCTIGTGAAVVGDMAADTLDVAGTLTGDAVVADRVVVRSSATVRGKWRAARVVIEPGASVSLRLDSDFDLDLEPKRRSR